MNNPNLPKKEEKNVQLRQIETLSEMSYERLQEVFSDCSPNLLPFIKKLGGHVDHTKIICDKHQTMLVLLKGEKQPCFACLAEDEKNDDLLQEIDNFRPRSIFRQPAEQKI